MWSPLTKTCIYLCDKKTKGTTEKLKKVLSTTEDINEQTTLGSTALHFAALGSNQDVVGTLLSAKADIIPNNNQETPLHWACKAGSSKTIQKLLRSLSPAMIQFKDASGKTAYDWATEYDREDAQKLIQKTLARKNKRRGTL
uniref:Uncharacterized protein n=1 Tax=Vannella robusta TaxID=1487602 RepID=A0A7S4MQ92_9EUKA|mmetsp:Transcript_6146/g.7583  ORF Transcript_6146/g.7583 Transcript_6146/m.7583 type:complete len:142 (+) Transcript_6146:186-611(+)